MVKFSKDISAYWYDRIHTFLCSNGYSCNMSNNTYVDYYLTFVRLSSSFFKNNCRVNKNTYKFYEYLIAKFKGCKADIEDNNLFKKYILWIKSTPEYKETCRNVLMRNIQ